MSQQPAAALRMVIVLSENWTMADPRDLRPIVSMAVGAEDAGFGAIMRGCVGRGSDSRRP
jgi:hypothetical protein